MKQLLLQNSLMDAENPDFIACLHFKILVQSSTRFYYAHSQVCADVKKTWVNISTPPYLPLAGMVNKNSIEG